MSKIVAAISIALTEFVLLFVIYKFLVQMQNARNETDMSLVALAKY